jgi:hypothetical protein
MATFTCCDELASTVPSRSVDSMMSVVRHVAYDYSYALFFDCMTMGLDIRWIANSYDSPDCYGEMTLATADELESACEKADYIRAINSKGERVTPTFSLV